MKDGIAYRNHTRYGCWIASYIERAAWDDDPGSNERKNAKFLMFHRPSVTAPKALI
jgi:hypothetical protein